MTPARAPVPPSDHYADRAARHAARRDEEARRSARISRLRLLTFLPAAACLMSAFARGASPVFIWVAVALFVAFAALVVWHARVEERVAWFEALRAVSTRNVARVARDWPALPPADPPPGLDTTRHPDALDLDLFGRASLFQWLGPAATPSGALTLAGWLLVPSDKALVLGRQQAAAVLAESDEWREQLAAHGVLAAGARHAEIALFLEWAEAPGPGQRRNVLLHVAVYLILAAIWMLLGLQLAGVLVAAFWLIPLLAGIVLSFALTPMVHRAFKRAGTGQRALSRYAALFEHATRAPAPPGVLATLQLRLSADGASAPQCMRQLNRILGFAELRTGAAIFHFPIQAFTLWDFHVLFALERWRRAAGRHVREWLDALAELDGLSALGGARYDNPSWCVPQIVEAPRFVATAMGHPLIPDGRRVPNDVELGPPGTLLLITGSNMSGKSTLLRAIGLNAVMTQAGGVACAESLRMPVVNLQTSIRVQDSLELGVSYFMAALARLKGVVDAAEASAGGPVLLYLLDEILQGTNSAERDIAVRAVARHLLDAGAIGAMTTHDLNLAGEEPIRSAARLVHFTETIDQHGGMTFDYRLRPGLATSRNALRLMQMIGIEL
ncbi:MAG: DNA mismatch repair protein [Acidobacteria bacterium]|nr:DNA mismatch repair protein [Acidobacteriota bacterium]MCA1652089.1 DNA mismatch repair protein [Acidobacteriota bacterium]